MKLRYDEMIVDAIFHLADRKGSSRDSIWKYLSLTYPDQVSDKKQFLLQLKRFHEKSDVLENGQSSQRFRLEHNFRNRYINRLGKEEFQGKPHLALKHALTTKTNNSKKGASKMKKARMSKTKRGSKALSKARMSKQMSKNRRSKAGGARKAGGAKKNNKTKGKGGRKSAKGGSSKAKGSKANQAKMEKKVDKQDKKMQSNKKKNQNRNSKAKDETKRGRGRPSKSGDQKGGAAAKDKKVQEEKAGSRR